MTVKSVPDCRKQNVGHQRFEQVVASARNSANVLLRIYPSTEWLLLDNQDMEPVGHCPQYPPQDVQRSMRTADLARWATMGGLILLAVLCAAIIAALTLGSVPDANMISLSSVPDRSMIYLAQSSNLRMISLRLSRVADTCPFASVCQFPSSNTFVPPRISPEMTTSTLPRGQQPSLLAFITGA